MRVNKSNQMNIEALSSSGSHWTLIIASFGGQTSSLKPAQLFGVEFSIWHWNEAKAKQYGWSWNWSVLFTEMVTWTRLTMAAYKANKYTFISSIIFHLGSSSFSDTLKLSQGSEGEWYDLTAGS